MDRSDDIPKLPRDFARIRRPPRIFPSKLMPTLRKPREEMSFDDGRPSRTTRHTAALGMDSSAAARHAWFERIMTSRATADQISSSSHGNIDGVVRSNASSRHVTSRGSVHGIAAVGRVVPSRSAARSGYTMAPNRSRTDHADQSSRLGAYGIYFVPSRGQKPKIARPGSRSQNRVALSPTP
jgi:hypothetical protein